MLQRWCEGKGIKVLTGTYGSRKSRAAKNGLDVALFRQERSSPAKLLVVAAGVAPNIGFLDGSGIEDSDHGVTSE